MVNDKIYELAKQVGLIEFESIPGSAAVTPDYESVVRARKFAELIVAECAMFVVVELEGQVGSLIADRTANRLEEHFGVEE